MVGVASRRTLGWFYTVSPLTGATRAKYLIGRHVEVIVVITVNRTIVIFRIPRSVVYGPILIISYQPSIVATQVEDADEGIRLVEHRRACPAKLHNHLELLKMGSSGKGCHLLSIQI